MKAKYVLLAILLATLLASPAFGFWHPPPPPEEVPPHPTFAVLINGEWAPLSNRYEFIEPEDNFCDDVTVEVFLYNVTDLYGYEFSLTWSTTYFELKNWVVESVWPSQFVVKPTATYAGSCPYEQVVAAMAPSTGVTGDIKLATLTFHIINDVCWLQGNITGAFVVTGKASDSCSVPIQLCDSINGNWKFVPVKPKIYMDPADEINWIVGDKYTLTIWAENVVKLKDVEFLIKWHGRYDASWGIWSPILKTTDKDIVINEDVFPAANRSAFQLTVNSPACGNYTSDPVGSVYLKIVMDCTYPLINGTFWIMKMTFTKCDPWFCGRQPGYTRTGEHGWICENASTPIYFDWGCFSVKCPGDACMWFYDTVTVENAKFTFLPIPGDLDGNGHVDIADLTIIAGKYGSANAFDLAEYNLDGADGIDIFDVVIVAKNFCRTSPF
jgi:hypothetical protein